VGNRRRISLRSHNWLECKMLFLACALQSHCTEALYLFDELLHKLPTWINIFEEKVSMHTLAQTPSWQKCRIIPKQFSYHSNEGVVKCPVVCTVVLRGLLRNLWEHVPYHCMLILTAWFCFVLCHHPGLSGHTICKRPTLSFAIFFLTFHLLFLLSKITYIVKTNPRCIRSEAKILL